MNRNGIFLELLSLGMLAACSSDYTQELPGGYRYLSESKHEQVIVPKIYHTGDIYIPCNVEAYHYNEYFIVARQRAMKDCFWGEVNSLQQVLGVEYFWIIDIETQAIHGPLTEGDYRKKRVSLNVPIELYL